MKKLLLLVASFALVFGLVACEDTETVDPAQATLQGAYDTLNGLISDPSNITGNFTVPTLLVGGVEATWSSDNPGVVTVGQPANNLAVVTVNRPAFGEPDAEVTLTATLTIASELDTTQELTLSWDVELTVKASEVEEVTIENIADVLALNDVAYDGTYQVSLENLTIVGKGSDSAFAYDGSGIIQMYGGDVSSLEVGKVYDVSGTTEWYFGIWEITSWTAEEDTAATPEMPTKETITDIAAYVNGLLDAEEDQYAYGDASSGAFETVYATVTGRVYVIPGDTSNYNTYLMPTNYDTTQTWVPGTTDDPTVGLMLYYNTFNMAEIKAYDGIVVTIDILIYTFRSNNKAFAFYYVGGADGIEATLTDGEKLAIDANALSLPSSILEPTTLVLPSSGDNGTTITWVSSDETIINSSTGEVTMPPTGLATVTLTATLEIGTETPVTKVFTIIVGDQSSIKAALDSDSGAEVTVIGKVNAIIDHKTFSVTDGEYAIFVYDGAGAYTSSLSIGDVVEIVGERGGYKGLNQVTNLVSLTALSGETLPNLPVLDGNTMDLSGDLSHLQGHYFTFTGVTMTAVTNPSYGNLQFTFTIGTQTFTVYYDNRLANSEAAAAHLYDYDTDTSQFAEGAVVNLTLVLGWSDGVQFRYQSEDDVRDVNDVPSSIEIALDSDSGAEVTVIGKVNAIIDHKTFSVTDGEYAIFVYDGAGAYTSSLSIGDVVEIVGERGGYKGLNQVTNLVSLTALSGETLPNLPVLDGNTMDLSGDLSHLQGHYFTFTGVTMTAVTNPSYGNLQFTFTIGTQTFTVYYDNRLANSEAAAAHLYDYDTDTSQFAEGAVVNLTLVLGWRDGVQFRYQSEDDVQIPEPEPTYSNVTNFTRADLTTSYSDGSFTDSNGLVWNFVHARNADTYGFGEAQDGIMLRRADEPSSLEVTLTNGLNDLSIEFRKAYTAGTPRTYEIHITNNGTTETYTIPAFGEGNGAQDTILKFTLSNLNLSGEVTVKIVAVGANGNQQATFNNFKWNDNPSS